VLGQCTPGLRASVESDDEYETKSSEFDALWLLEKLKKTMADMNLKANPAVSLHEQSISFFTIRQGANETDYAYMTCFNSRLKSLELSGGEHFL